MRTPPPRIPALSLVAALAASGPLALQAQPAGIAQAKWIWADAPGAAALLAPAGPAELRASFDLPDSADPDAIRMLFTADNVARVFVNGEEVGFSDDWQIPTRVSIGEHLLPGANEVFVEASNDPPPGNPAGLLMVVWEDGGDILLVTDGSWEAREDGDWGPALIVGELGMNPWGDFGFAAAAFVPDVPAWTAPGLEEEFEAARRMFADFYKIRRHVPFYDPWLTMGGAWIHSPTNDFSIRFRQSLRSSYELMRIDDTGYVSTHQHRGAGHPDGWPFPTWTQSVGWGHHFTLMGMPYGPELGFFASPHLDGFELSKVESLGFEDYRGAVLRVEPGGTLTTPEFDVDSLVSAFFRIDWVGGPEWHAAKPTIHWRERGDDDFKPGNSAGFRFDDFPRGDSLFFSVADLQDLAHREVPLVQFKIEFGIDEPAEIGLQAIMTTVDSRHNTNNLNFVRGAVRYANWTGEADFLETELPRMREAMAYVKSEFNTLEALLVDTPWVGKCGRSGLEYIDGVKHHYIGVGIGDNYWDLLPFGGQDTFATLYYYDAMMVLADLEERVAADPRLAHLRDPDAWTPDQWRAHAAEVKAHATEAFWNEETGRFTAGIDSRGDRADFGFVFLNKEAAFYDFATEEQKRAIQDWISGHRIVEGDTSTGDDIYHWRFGPRATTLRNIEYYAFIWPGPDSIPWGGQVQDGGAVLGFTHFDLMNILEVYGPDAAWQRYSEIIDWFLEVEAEGGYRAFYNRDDRGTLQGGGTAGGLGIDFEFSESILVASVLPYGFAGLDPRWDVLRMGPRLPQAMTAFELPGVVYQGRVLDLSMAHDEAVVRVVEGDGPVRRIEPANGWAIADGGDGAFARAGDEVRLVRGGE